MKIEVTEQDIQQGLKNRVCACPIALAMGRALNRRGLSVMVFHRSVSFWDTYSDTITCKLPKNAQNFIRKFDNAEKVKPFSFTIKYEN